MTSNVFTNAVAKSKQRDFKVIELFGAAEEIKVADGPNAVAELYDIWIEHNQDDPLLYAVLYNAGAAHTAIGNLDKAAECYEKSIKINADFSPSHVNLGRVNEMKGNTSGAALEWSAVIDRLAVVSGVNVSHKTTALMQLARVLEFNGQNESAENILQQSLEIDTTQRGIAQHLIAVRMRECKWPVIEPKERYSRDVLMKGLSPLSATIFTDDPMFQLAVNCYYNKCDVGTPVSGMVDSHYAACVDRDEKAPLRIGYLSSDLREHAIGFLTSELFELHNRKKVEVFAYYCGIDRSDPTMERIKKTVDHWIPINNMTDEAAARRIADDGIQILIDVNGYTGGARTKLLSMRPAPVIANWLGFPGSMASPYHHYIIADDWIIPPENEIYYSEKVMRLPCYQPNDRRRLLADQKQTRKEAGLPEDAMVYCCFNGTQKISQFTFERWLRILSRVPNSVLWLLHSTDTCQKHLWSIAAAQGISSDRIIFAKALQNAHHLLRFPLADLFLDTFPYGAHTTASDALWMGVPILTLTGRSFASRVCGSLLRSVGLSDLICSTPDEYVDHAVALGHNKTKLQHYRAQLAATRDTCVLFDTPLLVNRLEALFEEMWGDFKEGRLPQPDLRNLGIYFEVGMGHDCDKTEVLSIQDYPSWWQERLARAHTFRPIYPDKRFWTEKIMRQRNKKEEKKDDETHSGYWRRGLSRLTSLRKAAAKRR